MATLIKCAAQSSMLLYRVVETLPLYLYYELLLVLIQINQDGFMLQLIWMFLGCDLPIQLLLKSLSSPYNDRLIDRFHYVQINLANYKISTKYQTFMLEQMDLHVFSTMVYQYSCFFV